VTEQPVILGSLSAAMDGGFPAIAPLALAVARAHGEWDARPVEPAAEPLDGELLEAYLDRLGVDAAAPSFEALRELHRRHVERVPYETLWIQSGELWDVDPYRSARRIAFDGRGGYCYHLNGALAEVLRALGYAVDRHVGSVRASGMPEAESLGNHVVLTVRDLPTDDNAEGTWYVDAGLGDAMHEPLPLRIGTYRQGPFDLTLERPMEHPDQWRLVHDPGGGFDTMTWDLSRVPMDVFDERHGWLSTSPTSGFVRVAMAERRYATRVDVIRGLVRTQVGDGASAQQIYTERDEWFSVLADDFGLRFEASAPEVVDRLWQRVQASHREWEAQEAGVSHASHDD
jgi:N-hydroxyarylamine O-acetyltransferase